MPSTTNSISTDNADLITYHTKRIKQMPSLYFDSFQNKVVGEVSQESRELFQADEPLQAFLAAKKAVWRAISELRNWGGPSMKLTSTVAPTATTRPAALQPPCKRTLVHSPHDCKCSAPCPRCSCQGGPRL